MLANSIGSFHKQIEGMIEKAARDGNSHMRIFERLSTFPSIEREPTIEFSAEELEIFISSKQPDYMDKLLLLSRQYAACLGNISSFGALKTEWYELTIRLGQTTRSESGVSTTELRVPPNVANYINVKGDELENFANDLRSLVDQWNSFAFEVADGFEDATRHLFAAGERPGFALIDDDNKPANGQRT
jgi:hypothetical protein